MQYCTLQDQACIEASGADAVEFLRAQLTRDPPGQRGGSATAGWCDARGRVRAIFHVLRTADDRCVLVAERETAEDVLKTMRMYVLRAKVELRVEENWRVGAVIGDEAELAAWAARRGDAGEPPYLMQPGPRLAYLVGPAQSVEQAVAGLGAAAPQNVELEAIRLGLPRVRQASALQYVPQMLNLDRVDAVSFTKGCYPGQEVVARLHHRGAVKRRMQRFVFDHDERSAVPAPGDAILRDDDETVGEVIRAAAEGSRGELLAVVQLDALDLPLRIDDGGVGARLLHEPLPYDGA